MSMIPIPRILRSGACLAAIALAALLTPLHAQGVASILPNSNMQTDADGDGWPDGWPHLKNGGSWENEEGNRFIRMTSTTPGSMVMLYREVPIPAGVRALELSWRQRVTGLKKGSKAWFDARIMMEFTDARRETVNPAPRPVATGRDTDGWVERSTQFLVPEGAVTLKLMPALFNVEAGVFDIDDMVLKPVEAAPLVEAAAAAEIARAEKLVRDTEAKQTRAAAALERTGSLISNGDFETAGRGGDRPADWSGTWGTEPDGNRFLRLQSTEPDKMVMSFRTVVIPAGVQALELKLRWRITGLKPGAQPWFDARIMMDIKNAAGQKLSPQPSPVYSRRDTPDGGWAERTVSFLVPEGGVSLDFMPALFNVKAGTLDIDDVVLTPTDPAPIIAAQKEREARAARARVPVEQDNKANWPSALRVEGNRLVTVDSGQEVWLQGVNVASLEWSVRGEQVHKSIVVALDEWKGNIIRLPVKDDYWFGKDANDGGAAYRAIVDQAVTLAANRGAYLLLDLHRYRAVRPEYIDFWKDAATRYKNHPAVIFDLINEPHGISWDIWRNGGFVEERTTQADEDAFLTPEERAASKRGFQSPGMQALLEAVRATGANNLVLAGALDWAYDLSGITNGYALVDTAEGHGVMYATHVYPWKSGWQKSFLDAAEKFPILVGEFGANTKKMNWLPAESQEDAATWVPAILGLIQQHKLHWTAWCFHPRSGPNMLLDWDYTPTPEWGQQAKDALSGKQFPPPDRLR